MAHPLLDRAFYDAVCRFEESEEAQETYYRIMDTKTGRGGETIRDRILRAYAMLFCDDLGLPAGAAARPEDVEATADRLYVGRMSFDPEHWYRMQHHFPVIDEDNYDRFAALVIADLNAGPLRRAVLEGGDMLLLGEADPLHMTGEQRAYQHMRVIGLDAEVTGA